MRRRRSPVRRGRAKKAPSRKTRVREFDRANNRAVAMSTEAWQRDYDSDKNANLAHEYAARASDEAASIADELGFSLIAETRRESAAEHRKRIA